MEQKDRPVYRHVIVHRRAYMERVASPEQLRRLRQQIEAGLPLDEDVRHLYVKDSLKKSLRQVMNESGHRDVEIEPGEDGLDPLAAVGEAAAMKARGEERVPVRYRPQDAVVVARVNDKYVPGGSEHLPLEPTMLNHPGFDHADNAEAQYLTCARELQEMFRDFSDRKFLLMDQELRSGTTLVTVCITPITAAPRADVGLELYCEFHQTTRFGYVDTEGFEVASEVGEYPISPPSAMDLLLMMRPADEILARTDA